MAASRKLALWRRPGRVALVAKLCLLAAALIASGCDGRVRQIRAQLGDAELLRFDRGQKLAAPCWACHDFYGVQNKIGPHLRGIIGRRAGTASFRGYSKAMRGSGIVWTRPALDGFLTNPQGFVPGTSMLSPGIASSGDRDALLFYMELVTRDR